MKQVVDVAVPLIAFTLLMAVGLDLTREDFTRIRRRPALVLSGVLIPLAVLPLVALGLVAAIRPAPDLRTGLFLIAACPIGGISNTYSYLARASTALSVTLTGISSALAVVTIPLVARAFELAVGEPLGLAAPVGTLLLQLSLMLGLPVGLGMWMRHRWPVAAVHHRPLVQRMAFGVLAMLVVFVVWAQYGEFMAMFRSAVPLSAAFITIAMALGWTSGLLLGGDRRDRFTLAVEFATRNVAVATAMAVTVLGRVEFAVLAATYLLTEVPMMLAAVAAFRWRR